MSLGDKRLIKYSDALREATEFILSTNSNSIVLGLGVPYGAGGTTTGLKDKFPQQVLDTPTSEAALTGLAVGAAISGLNPIVHHDRVEFSLVAADQIFTQAAKWNYMFGGDNPVPIVIRIVIGRQWGNGPQHSQSFYSLFGNVTGLKVVIPSSPYMAKGMLIAAALDLNPVVVLEPRWIYNILEVVPANSYSVALNKMRKVKQGKDATVVAYGDGVYTALEAQKLMGNLLDLEILDLVSLNPIDSVTLFDSVKKTGRLICIDTTNESFNIGSELIALTCKNSDLELKSTPIGISCPNVPCPTSTALSEHYYPTRVSVCNRILSAFGIPNIEEELSFDELHLMPNKIMPVFK